MIKENYNHNKTEIEVDILEHYNKQLMDAVPFAPLKYPEKDSADMRNLVNELFKDFKTYEGLYSTGKRYRSHCDAFRQFLLNLYVSYLNLVPFYLNLGKGYWSTDQRFSKFFLTYKASKNVWSYLVKERLVVKHNAFQGQINRATRFSPSLKLYNLFSEIGEFRPEPLDRDTAIIELRDASKHKRPIGDFLDNPQDYMPIEKYNNMKESLTSYNEFADQQDLSMVVYNEIIPADFIKKTINNSREGKVLLRDANITFDIICNVRTNIPQIINHHDLQNVTTNHKIHKTESLNNGKVVINSNYHCHNRYIYNINNTINYHNTLLGSFGDSHIGSFSDRHQGVSYEYVVQKILASKINFSRTESFFASSFEYTIKNKSLTRVFNNKSVDEGGRCYNNLYQSIPSNLRGYLYLNGERVRELDYQAHHVNILYALEGVDYHGDPYGISKADDPQPNDPDFELLSNSNGNGVVFALGNQPDQTISNRNKMKVVMLVIFNAQDKESALKAIRSKLHDMGCRHGLKDDDITPLMEQFEATHKSLKQYFYSGVGLKLQNIDSRITMDILETMMLKGIPVLPVHDSYICPESNAETLEHQMRVSYQKILREVLAEDGKDHPAPLPKITWNRQLEINYDGILGIKKVA